MNAPSEPSRRGRKRRGKVGRTGARFPLLSADDSSDEQLEEGAVAIGDLPETPVEGAEPSEADGPDTRDEVAEASGAVAEDQGNDSTAAAVDEPAAEEEHVVVVEQPVPGESQPVAETPPEPVAAVPPEAEPDPEPDEDDLRNVLLDPDGDAEMDDGAIDDARSWVRPYVWTGGRTDTTLDFALETLVSARKAAENGDLDAMRDEHRKVLDLCGTPRSVSEIAALLSVPLGVAKTLLGAMAEEDMLVVHSNGTSDGFGPDLALMERVLRGLKNL